MDHLQETEKELKKKETRDSGYIYQNDLDTVCFQNGMAYGEFKYLTRRTASGKAFNIAKNSKYDRHQRGLVSMVYKFFDKGNSGSGIKNENTSNKELTEELQKPIIIKFNKNDNDNVWVLILMICN